MDISFKLEAFQCTALVASLTCDTQTVIVYCNYIVELQCIFSGFKHLVKNTSVNFITVFRIALLILCCACVLFLPTSPSSISQ